MTDRHKHSGRRARFDRSALKGTALLAALTATGWTAPEVNAQAVFDGTIGPNAAGTIRSGLFEISQQDGVTVGGNLFHSFSSFGVSQGELATFTHQSAAIEHIVARVTGVSPSQIHGGLQVRHSRDGALNPTSAALWLINPSGIVIGEGAVMDSQSTFVLSTANRLGFANGDSFHSHGPVAGSVLSIAPPTSFGFLDQQALPANVTPRGITVSVTDGADANTPLFLSNLTLVGTSIDPFATGVELSGDIDLPVDPDGFSPLQSSQFQAINLQLGALAAGGSMNVDGSMVPGLSAGPGTPLGSIRIEHTNLLISDEGIAPASGLTVLADHLLVDNSYIDTFAQQLPVPISIRATESVSLRGSVLQTRTFTAADGGDIRIDTPQYTQLGGLIASSNLDLDIPTGNPGNLLFGTSASLPMESFLLQQGLIRSFSTQQSQAGDVFLNVRGSLVLAGSPDARVSLASFASGTGASGDILLFANSIDAEYSDIRSAGFNPDFDRFISLQAGSGGIELLNTSVDTIFGGGRTGASLRLAADGNIALLSQQETSRITTGTSSDIRGGNIFIDAEGDLLVQGSFDISSSSLGDSLTRGDGGTVSLEGRNVQLLQTGEADAVTSIDSSTTSAGTGGTIVILAEETLAIQGRHDFGSNTLGPGASGAILLEAGSIIIESTVPTTLSTSSFGEGDAGIISLDARDELRLSGVNIDSAALESGAAGFILMSGATIDVDDSNVLTVTLANDANDVPAQIFIDAEDMLLLRASSLQSNSFGGSPAGQVSLAAGNALVVDNVAIQTATTGDGVTGGIFLDSGGDISLRGQNTQLLSNALGSSDAGDVSILAAGTLRFDDGGFVQTSSEGTGDAGTILLSADRVRLSLARIEGTSENGGGGDVNIFGRDIHLDGDLEAGGIVFISASSVASDTAGNGGSITLGNPLAPAELVFVRNSGLSASADAGNGGLININAQQFLRDARSIFTVTSTLGDPGSFEINAPEQDISAAVSELDVAILDASSLIRDPCALSPDDASSLVLGGQETIGERYDGYLTSDFQPVSAAEQPHRDASFPGALEPGSTPQLIAHIREGACRQAHR